MTGTGTNTKLIDIIPGQIRCETCRLQRLCPIARTGSSALREIVEHPQPLRYGHHLYRSDEPGHGVYVVRSGVVKTYTLSDAGDECVTGFHLPGAVLGLECLGAGRCSNSAQALETTSICAIPRRELEACAQRSPGLLSQLMKLMSGEILRSERSVLLLTRRTAEERVAAFLLDLSRGFEQLGYSPSEYLLAMSRLEIANYLGLAVETVSRVLSRFQERGVIHVDHRRVHLRDAALLGLGLAAYGPEQAVRAQPA